MQEQTICLLLLPETFLNDCRTCFCQIFRIYAHLYHSHWVDTFWHLSGNNNNQGWTDLNCDLVSSSLTATRDIFDVDLPRRQKQTFLCIYQPNNVCPYPVTRLLALCCCCCLLACNAMQDAVRCVQTSLRKLRCQASFNLGPMRQAHGAGRGAAGKLAP